MFEALLNQQRGPKFTRIAIAEDIFSCFCDAHCLTPREKQVFLQICTGKKNFLIATELGLSEATIRLHITNIHRKLNTGNKVDLLLKAFQWWLTLADESQCGGRQPVPAE